MRGRAVDEAVGYGDALVGVLAKCVVLAAQARCLDVVDPDIGACHNNDGIAAPNVLGVYYVLETFQLTEIAG